METESVDVQWDGGSTEAQLKVKRGEAELQEVAKAQIEYPKFKEDGRDTRISHRHLMFKTNEFKRKAEKSSWVRIIILQVFFFIFFFFDSWLLRKELN